MRVAYGLISRHTGTLTGRFELPMRERRGGERVTAGWLVDAGMSPKTWKAAVARLERLGLVEYAGDTRKRRGGGPGPTYRTTLPPMETA